MGSGRRGAQPLRPGRFNTTAREPHLPAQMPHHRRRWIRAGFALLAGVCLTGCFGTVEGKVKDLNQRGIEVEHGEVKRVIRF